MRKLTGSKILESTRLTELQNDCIFHLVGAPAPDDLGDGEAAIIASAIGNGGAVIDERKARRIIARDFPTLPTYCSLDILCSDQLFELLGSTGVSNAVTSALLLGRMRIPPEWRLYVEKLTAR